MVGGGETKALDIGLNSEPGVRITHHPGENFPAPASSAYGHNPPKHPISTRTEQQQQQQQQQRQQQQDFEEAGKLSGSGDKGIIPFASLERDFRGAGYQMEQGEPREDGGRGQGGQGDGEQQQQQQRGDVYGPQMGSMGRNGHEQEWGQGQEVHTGASDGSQSEGSDEEEDEEDEEEDGNNMVDNEGEEEDRKMVAREIPPGGLPLSHASQMGGMDATSTEQGQGQGQGQGRGQELSLSTRAVVVDGGFQRNVVSSERLERERERGAMKAAIGGSIGVSTSPFGIFHSPSAPLAPLAFMNPFTSPAHSNLQIGSSGGHVGGHGEVSPVQNGGGMLGVRIGAGSGPSYSLTREVAREGFRGENVAVGSLQEHTRITTAPLHEQLQSADTDNYYTTLLNTQINNSNNNNGMKAGDSAMDSATGRRRIVDPQSISEPSLRRILSDPLTGALMDDAMIISCGHSVGNAGLRRVMETSVCIICGASVRTDMVPNYALRLVIQAYKREEEMNGNSAIKSTKRRRDPVQESVGIPEQAASDAARAKGVQFPFVVSDRVMIKGNKRTPERFVGREAVITTQCLNGWYLVRTLDSGESVRLQYRSLQKVGGGQTSPNANSRPSGNNWVVASE